MPSKRILVSVGIGIVIPAASSEVLVYVLGNLKAKAVLIEGGRIPRSNFGDIRISIVYNSYRNIADGSEVLHEPMIKPKATHGAKHGKALWRGRKRTINVNAGRSLGVEDPVETKPHGHVFLVAIGRVVIVYNRITDLGIPR